jgi:hypothetical protein
MYKIIDYYTKQKIADETFKTKKEADNYKNNYLKSKLLNNEVHNNLLLVIKD